MEWYIPLTVLPAIALIILSTSNFLVGLNSELNQLERNRDVSDWIIDPKNKTINMTLLKKDLGNKRVNTFLLCLFIRKSIQ